MNEFEEKLKEAQEAGVRMTVSASQNSRAVAIAVTHLETAQLWAAADTAEKERIKKIQEESA